MSTEKLQRLPWFELDNGKYAGWMQKAFEEAQRIAAERGVAVELVSKIKVKPPERDDPSYSEGEYSVSLKLPARQSKYLAELHEGQIVRTGANVVELMQEQLDLFPNEPRPNVAIGE